MTDKRHILVIEDDETVRLILAKALEKCGAEVTSVSDGREAKEVLKGDGRYVAIILDLLLPYVSGWDILESLSVDPVRRDTPVIVFTGAPISLKERKALWSMSSAVMDKDTFNLTEFECVLSELLGC